jgi:hypothetical protein
MGVDVGFTTVMSNARRIGILVHIRATSHQYQSVPVEEKPLEQLLLV